MNPLETNNNHGWTIMNPSETNKNHGLTIMKNNMKHSSLDDLFHHGQGLRCQSCGMLCDQPPMDEVFVGNGKAEPTAGWPWVGCRGGSPSRTDIICESPILQPSPLRFGDRNPCASHVCVWFLSGLTSLNHGLPAAVSLGELCSADVGNCFSLRLRVGIPPIEGKRCGQLVSWTCVNHRHTCNVSVNMHVNHQGCSQPSHY